MGRRQEQPQGRIDEVQRELLKRFHEEDEKLHRVLCELRKRVRDAAASSGEGTEGGHVRGEAESLLGELEERLQRHFTSEEREGFLSQAVDHAPRLSRRADELRAECAQLAEGLASLGTHLRRAGPATERWRELDAECHRFTEAFHDHEHRENALIHEAWVEDIGAVD